MAVTSSARAGGVTVVTPVAMAAARPKSANCLILLFVLLIVILLGMRAMELVTPADVLVCSLRLYRPSGR